MKYVLIIGLIILAVYLYKKKKSQNPTKTVINENKNDGYVSPNFDQYGEKLEYMTSFAEQGNQNAMVDLCYHYSSQGIRDKESLDKEIYWAEKLVASRNVKGYGFLAEVYSDTFRSYYFDLEKAKYYYEEYLMRCEDQVNFSVAASHLAEILSSEKYNINNCNFDGLISVSSTIYSPEKAAYCYWLSFSADTDNNQAKRGIQNSKFQPSEAEKQMIFNDGQNCRYNMDFRHFR